MTIPTSPSTVLSLIVLYLLSDWVFRLIRTGCLARCLDDRGLFGFSKPAGQSRHTQILHWNIIQPKSLNSLFCHPVKEIWFNNVLTIFFKVHVKFWRESEPSVPSSGFSPGQKRVAVVSPGQLDHVLLVVFRFLLVICYIKYFCTLFSQTHLVKKPPSWAFGQGLLCLYTTLLITCDYSRLRSLFKLTRLHNPQHVDFHKAFHPISRADTQALASMEDWADWAASFSLILDPVPLTDVWYQVAAWS